MIFPKTSIGVGTDRIAIDPTFPGLFSMWPVKLVWFFLPKFRFVHVNPVFRKIFEISKKSDKNRESCHPLTQSYKEGQHSIAGAVEIPNMEPSNETTLAQDSVSTSQESVRTGISGWILAMVLQYSLGCAWDTEVLREKFCHSNFAKFARSSSSTSSQVALRGALFPKRWWSSDWYDKSTSWINLSFWKEVGNVINLARQSIRCCFLGGRGGGFISITPFTSFQPPYFRRLEAISFAWPDQRVFWSEHRWISDWLLLTVFFVQSPTEKKHIGSLKFAHDLRLRLMILSQNFRYTPRTYPRRWTNSLWRIFFIWDEMLGVCKRGMLWFWSNPAFLWCIRFC